MVKYVLPTKQRDQLVSAIRKIWRNSPEHKERLKQCLVDKQHGICPKCLNKVHKKLLEQDHVKPIGGLVIGCKNDVNEYIFRTFTYPVMILCTYCHSKKTHRKEGLEDL
jgi:hypothetical protein